jgi:hypothetical protein
MLIQAVSLIVQLLFLWWHLSEHPAFVQEEALVRLGLLQGPAQAVAHEECIGNDRVEPNIGTVIGGLAQRNIAVPSIPP